LSVSGSSSQTVSISSQPSISASTSLSSKESRTSLVSLTGTGSISFNATYKFPYGFDYTASQVSNAQDILTMISFDGSSLYSVAVKQLS
jgi:hypothetical protein